MAALGLSDLVEASCGERLPGVSRALAAPASGATASRPQPGRILRRATGKSPVPRSRSAGAISPTRNPASRHPWSRRSWRKRGCPASSATSMPRAREFWTSSATSTCAPESPSATRRSTACCRSRHTRRPSGWSGFTRCVASRAGSAIPCESGASSPGPSSATRADGFVRTAHRKDFAIPPPGRHDHGPRLRRGPRGRHARQDRRHLRPSLHGTRDQGRRQHGAVRRAAP